MKVAVIGSGVMGHGIAELFAMAGHEVWINDVSEEILKSALQRIRWSLEKLAERGSLKENVDSVMSRIRSSVDQEKTLRGAEFVVEVVKEDLELKREIFKRAERLASEGATLVSNTSSLPITEISQGLSHPERVAGMHFFNPPVLMPLVEIVRGEETSEDTVRKVADLSKQLGKEFIVVRDVPGFFVNRILLRIMEAGCFLVDKGFASVEEVDSTSMEELGFPMGVFLLADYTGLDVGASVWNAVIKRGFEAYPCRKVQELVSQGHLGVKSGRGFYSYPQPGKFTRPQLPSAKPGISHFILAPAVNEVASLIRQGIVSVEDSEKGCQLGLGLPKGMLRYADEIGLDKVMSALEEMKRLTGMGHFSPDPSLITLVSQGKLGRKTGEGFYKYEARERTFTTIYVKREPPLAWIVLNRPSRYNALNWDMVKELSEALDELEEDPEIRVIAVKGEGKAFCAGADVQEFLSLTPVKAMMVSRKFHEVFFKIQFLTKPVVAAINGVALGGGFELAMACDVRIASKIAEMGQPEVNLGLIPGGGGTFRLPRLAKRRGLELVITGERLKAQEALELGLVDKVVEHESLEDEVTKFAETVSSRPPLAVALGKMAVNTGRETNSWVSSAYEASLFGLLFSTSDFKEGVRAFLERRRPEFKGV